MVKGFPSIAESNFRRKAPLEICEAIAYFCVFEPLQTPNDFPSEIQEHGNEDVWGAYMFHRQIVQELASAFLEYTRACELLGMQTTLMAIVPHAYQLEQ